MTAPACSRIRIEVEPTRRTKGGYKISAFTNGDKAGFIGLERDRRGGRYLTVEYAVVTADRRCGIGTKMYERALQLACELGLPLASGHSRTPASEGFWRKQERKGRARCVSQKPASRLAPAEEGMGPRGEWPCGQYAMREACPRKIDLTDA
jgi:hypothetical protein